MNDCQIRGPRWARGSALRMHVHYIAACHLRTNTVAGGDECLGDFADAGVGLAGDGEDALDALDRRANSRESCSTPVVSSVIETVTVRSSCGVGRRLADVDFSSAITVLMSRRRPTRSQASTLTPQGTDGRARPTRRRRSAPVSRAVHHVRGSRCGGSSRRGRASRSRRSGRRARGCSSAPSGSGRRRCPARGSSDRGRPVRGVRAPASARSRARRGAGAARCRPAIWLMLMPPKPTRGVEVVRRLSLEPLQQLGQQVSETLTPRRFSSRSTISLPRRTFSSRSWRLNHWRILERALPVRT